MIRSAAVVIFLSCLLGCATTAPAPGAGDHAERASEPAGFASGETLRPLALTEVASRAALADVVIVGELHGHPRGLEATERLFREIARLEPRTTALGLEFYERDEQVALDDYLSGLTDEAAFRESTGKAAEKDPHRGLIEAAKAAGLRVWAMNAPRRYARLARTEGFGAYDAMTREQRRLVDVPEELTGGRYADTFYELMGGMGGHGEGGGENDHGASAGPSEMAVSFFRAQNVWDATMAATAARALDAGARPLVIVVGRFHSDFGGGLVERVQESAPGARLLTLSVLDADEPGDGDRGRADVLIPSGPLPEN